MWSPLTEESQLTALVQASHQKPQVLFKHSTRCSISRVALGRFDREPAPNDKADFHLLDLLQQRPLSQIITDTFGIVHESPQLLVIREGKCLHHANHLDIEPSEVYAWLENQ